MYFCFFVIISPWKLAQWFWRRRLFNSVNVFSLFRNYLHLEKGGTFHLYNLEFPSNKVALCQVWWKLAQRFGTTRFSLMYIFAIRNKGWALHLHKPEFPSPKAACSIFGVNWPSGSSEEDF